MSVSNLHMRRLCLVSLLVALGCGRSPGPLPVPARPGTSALPASSRDLETFAPAAHRPPCSAAVAAALEDTRPQAIADAARRGETFTCGPGTEPLPLDRAVMADRPDRVYALLEAGADPNAQWGAHGDRLPLQMAIESQLFGYGHLKHRAEIVKALLDRGADPDVRWCPYESRDLVPTGSTACVTAGGVTPLMMAAALDQLDVVVLLLEAGANVDLEDRYGASAIDRASSQAVLSVLLERIFPDARERRAHALDYLRTRLARQSDREAQWLPTPLMQAIAGGHVDFVLPPPEPPPPPPSPRARAVAPAPREDPHLGRARAILQLGADPNERIARGSLDWTPLALAMYGRSAQMVEVLLQYGADPTLRWCADVKTRQMPSDCTLTTAPTPLMWAERSGQRDIAALLVRYGAGSFR
jgi:ankyrin repeat protein